MTCFPDDVQDTGGLPHLYLAASECWLLADLLLNHIGDDPVRNDALNYLTQRLFVLAVQADRNIAQA